MYVLIITLALVVALFDAWRRNLFPIVLLGAAGAVAVPALLQAQQRDVHYRAMPMLPTFSAVASGSTPLVRRPATWARWFRLSALSGATIALILLFQHGANIRAFFVQTPYGHSLAAFRDRVSTLIPAGVPVCATLALSAPERAAFSAEIGGASGFVIPPISADGAQLLAPSDRCQYASSSRLTIALDSRGDFVARR